MSQPLLSIGILLFFILILRANNKRHQISSKDQQRIKMHWHSLPKDPSSSILEADKILDQTLNLKGYKGNLGEKLKQAHGIFSNPNNVWSAHKLRNRIAHELKITVSENEAKTALNQFKQAIKDLGITL